MGRGGDTSNLLLFVFDLLYLDGRDLRAEPLSARKSALAELMARARKPLSLAEYIQGSGREAAAKACEPGIEGIVSKALDAPYRADRGGAWLKIKCVDSDEFVVVGSMTASWKPQQYRDEFR